LSRIFICPSDGLFSSPGNNPERISAVPNNMYIFIVSPGNMTAGRDARTDLRKNATAPFYADIFVRSK